MPGRVQGQAFSCSANQLLSNKHDKIHMFDQFNKIKQQCTLKSPVIIKKASTISPKASKPLQIAGSHAWKAIMDSANSPMMFRKTSYIDYFIHSKLNLVSSEDRYLKSLYSSVFNWKKRYYKKDFIESTFDFPVIRSRCFSQTTSTINQLPAVGQSSKIPRIKKKYIAIINKINRIKKSQMHSNF